MRMLVPVAAAALLAALGLFALVPLTWDEALNFLHFSSHGALASLGTAQQPNYHWLFSALQSLIPAAEVHRHPPLLRIVNALVAMGTAAILYQLLRDTARPALLATLLLLCSPLFTLYLSVARGYLLGTLLLLCALLLRERPWIAGLLAGLSCACVPTFELALPGALLALDRRNWPKAIAAAALIIVPASIAARGTLGTTSQWGLTLWRFVPALVVPAWPSHVLLVLGLLFLVRDRPRGLALGLLGACASTLVAIVVLAFLGIVDAPYPRNLLFVPLFGWLAVLLATRARPAVVALLAAAAAVEAAYLVAAFRPSADPNVHPYLRELTPAPAPRAPFESLECDTPVALICELYAGARPVRPLAAVPATCATGSVRVPRQTVVMQPGARLACY
jgi:hypothetical protein